MRFIVGLVIILSACTDSRVEPRQYLPKPADPTLTLLVSNQSFDLSEVDIEIKIDGQLAVTGDFLVEGQHTWVPFDFDLGPGLHQIVIKSDIGEATLEKNFEMDDRKWVVVNFWYYAAGSPEPTPQQFSFDVFDEPPAFD